jgi:hypothetical protein
MDKLNKSMTYIVALALFAFVLVLMGQGAQAAQYCDPRVNWTCYKNWCESQGGRPYSDSRGVGCDVTAGSPGGSSGPSASPGYASPYGSTPSEMMLGVTRNLMESFQEGLQRGLEMQRQARLEAEQEWARQREEERQRLAEQDMLRRMLEAQQTQELTEAKARIATEIRELAREPLPQRPGLAVLPERDVFGIEVLKAHLTGAAGDMTDVQRRSCAGFLLSVAGDQAAEAVRTTPTSPLAAKAGLSEAIFLNRQAALAVQGGSLDVACAPPGNVEGGPVAESAAAPVAARAALGKRDQVNERIFERALAELQAYERAEEAVKAAEKEQRQLRQKLEALERQVQESKIKRGSSTSPAAGQPQDSPAQDDLMAQALAALNQSEDALAKADALYKERLRDQQEAKLRFTETGGMIERLQKNPQEIDAVDQWLTSEGRSEAR